MTRDIATTSKSTTHKPEEPKPKSNIISPKIAKKNHKSNLLKCTNVKFPQVVIKTQKMTRTALQKHIKLIKSKLNKRKNTLRMRVLMQEEFEDKYVKLNQAGYESDDSCDDEPYNKKTAKSYCYEYTDENDKDIDEEWDFGDENEDKWEYGDENEEDSKEISIIEELYR
ncbi:unnamed protein product [Bursaphelenchus okinawaensis]|uniref:Uncharacterized protein n=1 Tax=Bursaphelenchus okinawaensis TaxID=465554 RepID=A0A811L6Y9_9BILA|nr:unnamed protein product [Bursaphelenchus okinawaensis]CAG9117865.1 unnamed protein product [Bursaphelenchus okinawaensis]